MMISASPAWSMASRPSAGMLSAVNRRTLARMIRMLQLGSKETRLLKSSADGPAILEQIRERLGRKYKKRKSQEPNTDHSCQVFQGIASQKTQH